MSRLISDFHIHSCFYSKIIPLEISTFYFVADDEKRHGCVFDWRRRTAFHNRNRDRKVFVNVGLRCGQKWHSCEWMIHYIYDNSNALSLDRDKPFYPDAFYVHLRPYSWRVFEDLQQRFYTALRKNYMENQK